MVLIVTMLLLSACSAGSEPESGASTSTSSVLQAGPVDEFDIVLAHERVGRGYVPVTVTRSGAESTLSLRLDAASRGPTAEEAARGLAVAWSEPIRLGVTASGSQVTIDMDASIQEQVISSNYISGSFVIPLVGTAFLDPAVQAVTLTLDGSEQAIADWWEAVDATWTRDLWESRNW